LKKLLFLLLVVTLIVAPFFLKPYGLYLLSLWVVMTIAAIPESMVRSAGEIGRGAVAQRRARRGDRRPARAARPLHHLRRPGKADGALLAVAQAPGGHAPQVGGTVCPRDLVVTRGLGHPATCCVLARQHALAQRRVLAHRKPVPGRQRQDEMVRVVDSHHPILASVGRPDPRAAARQVEHELVQAPHESGRILELAALREQRLVEE